MKNKKYAALGHALFILAQLFAILSGTWIVAAGMFFAFSGTIWSGSISLYQLEIDMVRMGNEFNQTDWLRDQQGIMHKIQGDIPSIIGKSFPVGMRLWWWGAAFAMAALLSWVIGLHFVFKAEQ